MKSVSLRDNELIPDVLGDKMGVLDIKAITDNNVKINIEVQLANQYNIRKRTLFYTSKLFTDDLKEGSNYNDLKRTISINFLGFNETEEHHFHNIYCFKEKTSNNVLTEQMEIHLIEMPKFLSRNDYNLNNSLHRWLIYLNSKVEKLLEEVFLLDEKIFDANKRFNNLSAEEEFRRNYELLEKWHRDEISFKDGAIREGKKIGKEIGRKEGREEGKQEGRINGKKEATENIIRKLKDKGMSSDEISELLEIDADDLF